MENEPGVAGFVSACRAGDWVAADGIGWHLLSLPDASLIDLLRLANVASRFSVIDIGKEAVARALELDPNSAPAHGCMANLLRSSGDFQAAVAHAEKAVSLEPNSPDANATLGFCLVDASRAEEAIILLRKAIQTAPNVPIFHHYLGVALGESGNLGVAIQELSEVMRSNPNAESCFQIARFLAEDRKHAEAEMYIQKALELDPNHSRAHEAVGLRLTQKGDFEEAAKHFRKAIKLAPNRPDSYYYLLKERKVTEADRPILDQLQTMFSEKDRRDKDIRLIAYALGKACEDLGEYERAMEFFNEANRRSARVLLGRKPYAREAEKLLADRMIDTFTPSFFEIHKDIQRDDRRPIFIVGMMRSGTTLVEQILSCHPDVTAGGEILYWMRPENVLAATSGDEAALSRVGEGYSCLLSEMVADAIRVTDKMPQNHWMLGAIRSLFPQAKVIHCRRNAVNTCLSIYTTPLRGSGFLFDKSNIVFAYKEYLRLMDHWRRVLPADFMTEIDYETLVSNREPSVRSLLEFCGLSWDDACLHHESNGREVATPSRWQVRQPIYDSSVGRWKRYEPSLGEFRELL